MALIPQDELLTFKTAADVKAVASTAVLDQEKQAIAALINTAANTGETSVLVNHRLSDAMITTLEGAGYTLNYNMTLAHAKDEVIISWDS